MLPPFPARLEQRLLDAMSEAVVALDMQYVVAYWNRAAARLLGWEAAEAVGHQGVAADLGATSPVTQGRLRECLAAGRPFHGLLKLRRRSGDLVSVDATISAVQDESGAPLGLVAVGRATSASWDAAWALSPCGSVLRNSNDAIAIANEQGLVVSWNPAAERVLGWTASEALGRPLREVLPIEQLDPEAGAALRGQGAFRGELAVPDRDGCPVTLDVELSRVSDDDDGEDAPARGCLAICRDITALKHAAQALRDSEMRLRESEEQFRSLVEQKQVGVYVVQRNRFKYVNPKFIEIVGYDRSEVMALSDNLDFVHPEDRIYVAERQRQRLLGETISPYSFRVVRKSGEVVRVEVYGTRTQYQGKPAIIGTLVDITERTRAEEALRESEARYRALVDSLSEGVLLVDRELRVITCNESAARLFGLTARQLSGSVNLSESLQLYRESMAALPPDERPEYVTLRSGTPLKDVVIGVAHGGRDLTWISVNTQPLHRPSEPLPYAVVVSLVDITDRKRAEAELHRQAFYDKLTGLPNRALFQDRVERALTQARRNEQLVAVCFIDLDRFKQINDALGHAIGDVFLHQVGQRLSRCLREGDTVARLGGDEFTLLLPALTSPEDAVRVAERVLDVLRQPFYVGAHLLRITASIGISLWPHDGIEVSELLQHADAAMYRVKSAGKDSFQLFTPEVNAEATRRLGLEAHLWHSLTEKTLHLHLRPVLELASGELHMIDVSPQWPLATEGLLSPEEVVAVSEDVDLVSSLNRWTLRQGCQRARAFLQAGLPTVRCIVRVPPRLLGRRELCADVREALKESGLPPERLLLVLTLNRETVAAANLVELALELREVGVLLLLGGLWEAGLPLQHLHQLPLMALHLESQLLQRLDSEPKLVAVCQGLIALGRSLGLAVVAEGVDSPSQLTLMRRLGCEYALGQSMSWPQSLVALRSPLIEPLQCEGGTFIYGS
jgi:diguanylate cyclase (GGDEF)-like protein/PAS domain S-box-containing protein